MAELRDLLLKAGYRPYGYSGRAMYGSQCVAVNLPKTACLFELALDLAEQLDDGDEMPDGVSHFSLDDMGLGIVVYWRHEEWDAAWDADESEYPWRCPECRHLNRAVDDECYECGYVPEEDEG